MRSVRPSASGSATVWWCGWWEAKRRSEAAPSLPSPPAPSITPAIRTHRAVGSGRTRRQLLGRRPRASAQKLPWGERRLVGFGGRATATRIHPHGSGEPLSAPILTAAQEAVLALEAANPSLGGSDLFELMAGELECSVAQMAAAYLGCIEAPEVA